MTDLIKENKVDVLIGAFQFVCQKINSNFEKELSDSSQDDFIKAARKF